MKKGTAPRISLLSIAVKQVWVKAPLIALALMVLTGFQCGKRKPPEPPRERVQQRAELSGFQRGNTVVLSWKMPARNADAAASCSSTAEIYRLAEPLTPTTDRRQNCFALRSLSVHKI